MKQILYIILNYSIVLSHLYSEDFICIRKKSYVGRIIYSHISSKPSRVYVATENNVVAALTIYDGMTFFYLFSFFVNLCSLFVWVSWHSTALYVCMLCMCMLNFTV